MRHNTGNFEQRTLIARAAPKFFNNGNQRLGGEDVPISAAVGLKHCYGSESSGTVVQIP